MALVVHMPCQAVCVPPLQGLATARFWTPADYIQSQRVRARANIHFRRAFKVRIVHAFFKHLHACSDLSLCSPLLLLLLKDVDVLITPTTPCTAPPIPRGALAGGASDLGQVGLSFVRVIS